MPIKPTPVKPIIDLTDPIGRFAAFVLLVAVFSLYFPINWPWGSVHILKTPLDAHIPLLPIFVIPYVFFMFLWGGVLLGWSAVKNDQVFLRLIFSFIVSCLIAYAVYLLFQTVVPRPGLEVDDLFTRILKWIYATDRRYNAFPSGHTVSATILLLTTWPLVRIWWKVFFLIVALSIIASTLFLKQHFVPDIFAGLLVGAVGWWVGKQVAPRFIPSKS